jgi:hypothetical protein
MALRTYEVDVRMVVEVSRVRVTVDTEASPHTHEFALAEAAAHEIDVRAADFANDHYVSDQRVKEVLNWNQIG